MFTNRDIEVVVANYHDITAKQIQFELLPHLSVKQVYELAKQLRKLGLLNKKFILTHNYNREFFKYTNNINSYWAGFIAADGNVNNLENQLKIKLSLADKDHLEKFKKDIEYSGDITESKNFISKYNKEYYSAQIRLCSTELCFDLQQNFNIIPNKTLVLQPPINLNPFHSLCFIKGYIDGDGQINIYKSRKGYRFRVGWAGTEAMMEWIRYNINNILSAKSTHKLRTNGNIKEYIFEGSLALELARKLKEIDTPELDRKWCKIREWEEITANKTLRANPKTRTEDDDQFILDNFYNLTTKEIHSNLSHLTYGQIKGRISYFLRSGLLKSKYNNSLPKKLEAIPGL